MDSHSVTSNSLRPHEQQPAGLLCPWDSPGKNTGVGCHALLQGIFPTQGSNPRLLCLLHWQAGPLPLLPPGKPSLLTGPIFSQKAHALLSPVPFLLCCPYCSLFIFQSKYLKELLSSLLSQFCIV